MRKLKFEKDKTGASDSYDAGYAMATSYQENAGLAGSLTGRMQYCS
jgi:hypothetical protein